MSETEQASAELEFGIEGRLGIIALNRPQAINALSRGMIDGIAAQLEAWRNDDGVRAVLFEGRGERGFCSGGDVRAARALILEGRADAADGFFTAEYAMNAQIAGYPKPVISLAHGIVMGGGIGISGHADFRFSTQNARFAMPEGAIGFIPDVGVNHILGRAPESRALLFLMTGLPVGAADALALGLIDCVVPAARLETIKQGLVAAAESADIETAIVALMSSETLDPGEATLCAAADLLAAEFGNERPARDLVAAITQAALAYPQVAVHARTLAQRCPASLEATVEAHRAARRLPDIEAVLALDLRLAKFMSRRADFAEGVRAVLIDKDGSPKWDPADLAAVPRAAFAAVIDPDAADRWTRKTPPA